MGTQQILLIVLSVIIVGIAVAVGITMFNQQAINSNRNAVIADLTMFGSQAMAWYKTPETHGGCGSDSTSVNFLESNLKNWIGFQDNVASGYDFKTGNGDFDIVGLGETLEMPDAGTGMVIESLGNEAGVVPYMELRWSDGKIFTYLD